VNELRKDVTIPFFLLSLTAILGLINSIPVDKFSIISFVIVSAICLYINKLNIINLAISSIIAMNAVFFWDKKFAIDSLSIAFLAVVLVSSTSSYLYSLLNDEEDGAKISMPYIVYSFSAGLIYLLLSFFN